MFVSMVTNPENGLSCGVDLSSLSGFQVVYAVEVGMMCESIVQGCVGLTSVYIDFVPRMNMTNHCALCNHYIVSTARSCSVARCDGLVKMPADHLCLGAEACTPPCPLQSIMCHARFFCNIKQPGAQANLVSP